MNISEITMLIAVLLGPVLAVQAQKWIERARENNNRKLWIFHTLMATRAARVSADHVKALNMIDLAFYGRRFFSMNYKTKREKQIADSWKEYFDHLHQSFPDAELSNWTSRGEELFINLLFAISRDVSFDFDRVSLKRGIYSPRAHGEFEFELLAIRKLLLRVLSGETSLNMAITSLPIPQGPAPNTGATDTPPKQI